MKSKNFQGLSPETKQMLDEDNTIWTMKISDNDNTVRWSENLHPKFHDTIPFKISQCFPNIISRTTLFLAMLWKMEF